MVTNETRAPAAMVILPCPTCGRAVKVLGRVRRVLCACGQVLMEMGHEGTSKAAAPATVLEAR
jgi:hypothetical protein